MAVGTGVTEGAGVMDGAGVTEGAGEEVETGAVWRGLHEASTNTKTDQISWIFMVYTFLRTGSPGCYRLSHYNNFTFTQDLQADIPIKSKVIYAVLCK